MTAKEILAELESLSNEKTMAHNTKSGAGKNQFGVKMGDIRKIAKKIKTNHQLALELWRTKIIDAQLLACLIIKPNSLSKEELYELVSSMDFVHVADWFNNYVIKEHPEKDLIQKEWLNSENKWAVRSAWSLTANSIAKGAEEIDLEKTLELIKKDMPNALPEIQWTMNFALAYIGINHPKYRKESIEIGEELGIYRDFPVSKGCTSPFAPIWINEMVKRQKNK